VIGWTPHKKRNPKGWVLPLTSPKIPRANPGLLLSGDAGSFVSPLSGGGIENAIKTAIISAQVSHEVINSKKDLHREITLYEKKWREANGKSISRDRILQWLFSLPGMSNIIIHGLSKGRFIKVINGLF
jgi:flavin-dependent dehydrogenase